MGIQATGNILPCPYSPGRNGAGEGDRGAQGRCPSCALHAVVLQCVPGCDRPLHPPWHEEHAKEAATRPAPLWPSPGHYTTPRPLPWGEGSGGSPQPSTDSLCPVLPAPITTASYSRCSRPAAPAWASRAPGCSRDRCQPRSKREGQPMPGLTRSPAAIAPQCLATAALCPAAWTLLSPQSFSQGFRTRGGLRGWPWQQKPCCTVRRCVPALAGRLGGTGAHA